MGALLLLKPTHEPRDSWNPQSPQTKGLVLFTWPFPSLPSLISRAPHYTPTTVTGDPSPFLEYRASRALTLSPLPTPKGPLSETSLFLAE